MMHVEGVLMFNRFDILFGVHWNYKRAWIHANRASIEEEEEPNLFCGRRPVEGIVSTGRSKTVSRRPVGNQSSFEEFWLQEKDSTNFKRRPVEDIVSTGRRLRLRLIKLTVIWGILVT